MAQNAATPDKILRMSRPSRQGDETKISSGVSQSRRVSKPYSNKEKKTENYALAAQLLQRNGGEAWHWVMGTCLGWGTEFEVVGCMWLGDAWGGCLVGAKHKKPSHWGSVLVETSSTLWSFKR